MKKDLQKVVKAFRDEQETPSEYPKAMMTAQQMSKGTATINCGRNENGKARSEKMIKYPPFLEWCKTFGVKATEIEVAREASYMLPQYQIRVTY